MSVSVYKELTPKELGHRIAIAREQKNLSQREVEKLIGVTGVGQWEKGRNFPELGNLLRVAQALDRPLSYFFGDEYDRRPQEQRLAEELAKHIASILQKRSSQAFQKSWVKEFLRTVRYNEVANASALALQTRVAGPKHDRMQKAIAKLDPEILEAIVRHAAREILAKFIIYVKSESATR